MGRDQIIVMNLCGRGDKDVLDDRAASWGSGCERAHRRRGSRELRGGGPRRAGHLPDRGRSRSRDLVRAAGGPAGGRRRPDRDRHAVHRPDGRRAGDPGGEPARAARPARAWPRTLRPGAPHSAPAMPTTPIVLMGYYNPIYAYGNERFLADAKAAGVDGLIVVDLPPEEDAELCLPARAAGPRLHPPGHADHRRPAAAGGAREHLGLHLLCLGHRHHRPEGGRGRAGGARRSRASSGTRACRWPSASASASRRRRPRSRASPMPPWSARRWSTWWPATSTRDGRAGPALVPAVHAKVRALAEAVRERGPMSWLTDYVRPKIRALYTREKPELPENLWHQCAVLRADDLPPRPRGQPAGLPALRPPHAGRPGLPLRRTVRRGQLAADRDAARARPTRCASATRSAMPTGCKEAQAKTKAVRCAGGGARAGSTACRR